MFPYPPPVECKWSYMARYFEIGDRSEACRQLALKWAEILRIVSFEHEAEAPVKTMWVLSRGGATECYRYLRETEKQLEKMRSRRNDKLRLMRNSSIGEKLHFSAAAKLEEDGFVRDAVELWMEFEGTQLRKRWCAKCGIIMSQKCKRCSMCAIRYCSKRCQRCDWAVHRGRCLGRKLIGRALIYY